MCESGCRELRFAAKRTYGAMRPKPSSCRPCWKVRRSQFGSRWVETSSLADKLINKQAEAGGACIAGWISLTEAAPWQILVTVLARTEEATRSNHARYWCHSLQAASETLIYSWSVDRNQLPAASNRGVGSRFEYYGGSGVPADDYWWTNMHHSNRNWARKKWNTEAARTGRLTHKTTCCLYHKYYHG